MCPCVWGSAWAFESGRCGSNSAPQITTLGNDPTFLHNLILWTKSTAAEFKKYKGIEDPLTHTHSHTHHTHQPSISLTCRPTETIFKFLGTFPEFIFKIHSWMCILVLPFSYTHAQMAMQTTLDLALTARGGLQASLHQVWGSVLAACEVGSTHPRPSST